MRTQFMVLFMALLLVLCGIFHVYTAQEQLQDVHTNIVNDLMSIRKEFPASQPKVYSILDRVSRMYDVTKSIDDEKASLKMALGNQDAQTQKLSDEVNSLKTRLLAAEIELKNADKRANEINKELQNEKSQAKKLSQEKLQLTKEQLELQAQMNKIKTEKEKKQNQNNDELLHELDAIKSLKELPKKDSPRDDAKDDLSEDEKILLKQAQSLSLSSTSAPSSPR